MKHHVCLLPRQISFYCHREEDFVSAARRSGIRIPVSCRNGVCHLCTGYLNKGRVVLSDGKMLEAVPERRSSESEPIVLCRSKPLGACEIIIENVLDRGEQLVKRVCCQIEKVAPIRGHVYQVLLRLPAGKPPAFFAGQYLAIELPEWEAPAFFSLASAPGGQLLELHIQADPHLDSAVEIIDHLKASSSVVVTMPFGKACVSDLPEHPLILVAAGTGFAQMKSIIEAVYAEKPDHPITLYWGVRKEADMYLLDQVKEWSDLHPGFRFRPVISESELEGGTGHHSRLADAVLEDEHDLGSCRVIVSGSPRLVYTTMDALTEAGLAPEHFNSDVLEYAPRAE